MLKNILHEDGKIVAVAFREGVENNKQYVEIVSSRQAQKLIRQGIRIATDLKPALDYELTMQEFC